MKIVFGKSKWEMWRPPLADFLKRVVADGFEATEIHLKYLPETSAVVAALHQQHRLRLVAQVITEGETPDAHLHSLEAQFQRALDCRASLINSHVGKDHFPFDENLRLFRRALTLSETHDLPLLLETHRGRPTFSIMNTLKLLDALPALRLTADISHWMVVHESDLSDQADALERILHHCDYIHARVGYEQGPQVSHPGAPEWRVQLERHLGIWQHIVDLQRDRGADELLVTPEFGPPAYAHTLPFTDVAVADVWDLNVYMKEFLEVNLNT